MVQKADCSFIRPTNTRVQTATYRAVSTLKSGIFKTLYYRYLSEEAI